MNLPKPVTVLLVCHLLTACSDREYLSKEELTAFVADEDNGLSRSVTAGDVQVKVSFRPADLLVAGDLKHTTGPSDETVRLSREKYNSQYYFILSISKSGQDVVMPAAGPGFSTMLETISFRLGEFVNLTTPADTIQAADYIYNRAFGMSRSTDILFAFERPETSQADEINFNMKEFGLGIGTQSFAFKISDLEKAPKIFKP